MMHGERGRGEEEGGEIKGNIMYDFYFSPCYQDGRESEGEVGGREGGRREMRGGRERG